jgi:antitoxin component YwqK of YwqJK toxin-antitoxin module
MRHLALPLFLLALLAGVWAFNSRAPDSPGSPPLVPLEEEAAPRELRAGPPLGDSGDPSPGLATGTAPSRPAVRPGSRRKALGLDLQEHDVLLETSPPRPEPGRFETPFLQERHPDGELCFEAQQAKDPSGIWLLHGGWTSWYENGQIQEKGWYDMNRETGQWHWWDENGQEVARGSFVAGKRDGPWTFWYSNGVKQADANYADGKGMGLWTLYHDDGQKNAQGQFIDGEIAGYWKIWDEFGELNPERTGFYEAGELVSH